MASGEPPTASAGHARHGFALRGAGLHAEAEDLAENHRSLRFWFSMYCLTMASGEPPTASAGHARHGFALRGAGLHAEAEDLAENHRSLRFWFSMYCLTMASGEPPTVETKYELVHEVGNRVAREGNSLRNVWVFRRASTGLTNTCRRYLGHQTTGYLQE